MQNVLQQLKQMTTLVADTGDIEVIGRLKPMDATTNPSLLLKAASLPQCAFLLDDALEWAKAQQPDSPSTLLALATDKLAVNFGCEILKQIPGRVSTEVDARLSFDTQASIAKARQLIRLYNAAGIPNQRVLIKLAATWEGIQAAKVLEQENIQCNLTLLFSFAQARACAEAGVYLISPFVGRILDWYKSHTGRQEYSPQEDPGVLSVSRIYRYFRAHDYPTVIMGASFRNCGEILALAGCDRLTISPELMDALAQITGLLERKLLPPAREASRPTPLNETQFRWELNEDAMAVEKLAEGIRNFAQDQVKLEQLLAGRIG